MFAQEVIEVQREVQQLVFSDKTVLKFDSLLIATGGIPRNFWPETRAMKNIFVVRGVADAVGLEKAIEAKGKPRILVIGSSFIGMEAAAILVKSASELIVVGMEKVPFERVLGDKIGLAMQKMHEDKGVKFRMNVVIKSFEGLIAVSPNPLGIFPLTMPCNVQLLRMGRVRALS